MRRGDALQYAIDALVDNVEQHQQAHDEQDWQTARERAAQWAVIVMALQQRPWSP